VKDINKIILTAAVPSILSLVTTLFTGGLIEQLGKNISDYFFPPDKVPVARAQPINKIVQEGETITLTADGSKDSDGGDIVSFSWVQVDQTGILAPPVSEAGEASVNFTAPNVTNDVDLSFQLIVEDDEGTKNNDTAVVTVKSKHPLRGEWGENNFFNQTQGIAVEHGYGNIFVVDRNNNRILKFDNDGDPILQWGQYGTANGSLISPAGIAIDPDFQRGYIFVTDAGNNRIQKFADWSENLTSWGSFCDLKTGILCKDPDGPNGNLTTGDGQFHYPQGVAVDGDGNVYIADTSNHRIQKFDSNGTFITKWGSACVLDNQARCVDPDGPGKLGAGDGQFFDPKGIAVNLQTGEVFVVDKKNSRIQKFDSDGNFLAKWTNTTDGRFDPNYIAVDSRTGKVYVTDERYRRVVEFDTNGNYISEWGVTNDHENPLFENPEGIAISPYDPVIYIADEGTSTIKMFGLQPN
jgi:DNA-binding beta-propeller fold protein YncE